MDDKLILGLTPDAVTHVINQMGNDCPAFQSDPEEGEGCTLCAEVITEATAALRDAMAREKEEQDEAHR